MRYMLMMHVPRGTCDWQVSTWTPEDLKAHHNFMHRLNRELTDSGELVGAEGLSAPGEAKVVRAGKGGVPAVTDGPFPEAKESWLDTGSSRSTGRNGHTRSRLRPRQHRGPAVPRSSFRSRCAR